MNSDNDSDLIKLQNLTVRRHGRVLIENINATLPKAGLVVLLGANGAGKSSLLRLLAGVSAASKGQLYVPSDLSIGWMPEPARFYRHLTVIEQLKLQADLLNIRSADQAVQRVLCAWDLKPVSHQLTHHLSLGYRQRLSLAQAVLAPVDVLLLDEPMNGMDPDLMQQFKAFIAQFKLHKLVLMATHLMAEVSELTDWAMVMHQGQVLTQKDFRQQKVTAVDLLHFHEHSLAGWKNRVNHG